MHFIRDVTILGVIDLTHSMWPLSLRLRCLCRRGAFLFAHSYSCIIEKPTTCIHRCAIIYINRILTQNAGYSTDVFYRFYLYRLFTAIPARIHMATRLPLNRCSEAALWRLTCRML